MSARKRDEKYTAELQKPHRALEEEIKALCDKLNESDTAVVNPTLNLSPSKGA